MFSEEISRYRSHEINKLNLVEFNELIELMEFNELKILEISQKRKIIS